MFDQPCLEIIFVLHLDKRISNKSNKGEQDRNANQVAVVSSEAKQKH